MESIGSALGPISHSLSGIAAFTKAIIDGKPWLSDPKTPEIVWRQDMYELAHLKNVDNTQRKPVFGVMRWDNYLMPWPPVRRAIEMAVTALITAGYEGAYQTKLVRNVFLTPV